MSVLAGRLTMAITVAGIEVAVRRVAARMPSIEAELNAADAKLGDGDTGGMLARMAAALADADLSTAGDVGAAFMALARAGAASTGSSLGTLIVASMMTLGRETRDAEQVEWSELGTLVAAVQAAIMQRGKAQLGDKTVVDGLDYLAQGLEGANDADSVRAWATAAVDQALADFRERRSKMGRARTFADRSVGLDDPGMLALKEVVHAIAAV
ncbi:DAK2 domain-containing protein [Microbaculum marinum]|uniref:DAK2 domain-containing protein n=1 Tax=Microbaculum marinum TaxID=1764581 RepID=A0AAW9RP12_9HYPH